MQTYIGRYLHSNLADKRMCLETRTHHLNIHQDQVYLLALNLNKKIQWLKKRTWMKVHDYTVHLGVTYI